MKEIEDAFGSATLAIFGHKLTDYAQYAQWLHAKKDWKVGLASSRLSGEAVRVAPLDVYRRLSKNAVTFEESLQLGLKSIDKNDVDLLSLANASKKLMKIKSTTCETVFGKNEGTEGCACYGPTQFCLGSSFCWFSKTIAYSIFIRESEALFGCSNVLKSKFCIHCHGSTNLTRCFEVADSNDCTDCLFCHHCENVDNGLFCFHLKSKRYAIGNVEVKKEEYLRIRKMVLEELARKLEKDKSLPFSIYNIGARPPH